MDTPPMQQSSSPLSASSFRSPELAATKARIRQHAERCRRLPPPQPGETDRLVAAFLKQRGVSICPPAFAVAITGR
ncbi:hypothetical protein M0638_14190 [Roseomonas sp. NAR14]|uniref:Uncharacterized protein n=1 Tax=Roseomonas acroporae TaxID=2937791 RepID=A0A9X1YG08_9PROT|nr:hypothetical protein [Roseomonas acroporae]MCK8785536.1 hypothetical protein [Roseomonas acroporae]